MQLRNSTSQLYGKKLRKTGNSVPEPELTGSKRRLWRLKASAKIRSLFSWINDVHRRRHC